MRGGWDAQPPAAIQSVRLLKERVGLVVGKAPIIRRHQVDDLWGTRLQAHPPVLLTFESVGLQGGCDC